MPERFAVYGFHLDIPDDWRVEFNPKSNRSEGDVAFHSPKNNILFVSWGKLEDAKKRYASLEAHRDDTVKRIRKSPNITDAKLSKSERVVVSGHDGLRSEVTVQQTRGIIGRRQLAHDVMSVHFYCEETGRFYVVHWDITVADEYPDAAKTLSSLVASVACHSG